MRLVVVVVLCFCITLQFQVVDGEETLGSVERRLLAGRAFPISPINSTRNRCSPYTGTLCREYLRGQLVTVSPNTTQDAVERRMRMWLATAYQSRTISDRCWPHAKPLVCRHLFSPCDATTIKPICREDCQLLQSFICRKEFLIARSIAAVEQYIPQCSALPKRNQGNASCASVLALEQNKLTSGRIQSLTSRQNSSATLHKKGHLRCWFHVGRLRSKNDVQVTWSHDRKVISKTHRRFKMKLSHNERNRLGAVLIVHRTLKRDKGIYTCNIQIGSDAATCTIDLDVIKGNKKKGKRRRLKHLTSIGTDYTTNKRNKHSGSLDTAAGNARYGECRPYRGKVCAKVFQNYSRSDLVFEYNHSPQYLIERQLLSELKFVETQSGVSPRCKSLGLAVLCLHMFQACGQGKDEGPLPRLCKQDCLAFHDDYCYAEISGRGVGLLDLAPDCDSLLDNEPKCVPLARYDVIARSTTGIDSKLPNVSLVLNTTEKSSLPHRNPGKKRVRFEYYILPAIGGILVVAMVVVAIAICKRSSDRTPFGSRSKRNNNNHKHCNATTKCVSIDEKEVVYVEKLGDGAQSSLWFANINDRRKKRGRFIAERMETDSSSLRGIDHQKEIEHLRKLKHRGLLCPAFASKPNEQPFLVYDIRNLSDLKLELNLLRQPTLTLFLNRFILSVCEQVSQAMVYLHKHNLTHGDVAAHCCYVNMETGTVRLARHGFGLYLHGAEYLMHKTRGALPVRWMAPETLHDGKQTPQSDVWSFGVFVWELYSYGEMPYKDISNSDALNHIDNHLLLDCPEHCPDKIFAFMRKCWHVSPEQRPSFSMTHDIFTDWCPDPLSTESHGRYYATAESRSGTMTQKA